MFMFNFRHDKFFHDFLMFCTAKLNFYFLWTFSLSLCKGVHVKAWTLQFYDSHHASSQIAALHTWYHSVRERWANNFLHCHISCSVNKNFFCSLIEPRVRYKSLVHEHYINFLFYFISECKKNERERESNIEWE